MIFKDRRDAGERLSDELLKNKTLLKKRKDTVVVSLLRGGVIVGQAIAKRIRAVHLPLAVTKISSPFNQELAIGALCFSFVFLQKKIIHRLHLKKEAVDIQISIAKIRHLDYIQKFNLNIDQFKKKLRNKTVLIVDDGIATGATVKAALLFIKSKKPKKIILAVPVSPLDFIMKGFNKTVILHKDAFFSSVSQFYEHFPQVEDKEAESI